MSNSLYATQLRHTVVLQSVQVAIPEAKKTICGMDLLF